MHSDFTMFFHKVHFWKVDLLLFMVEIVKLWGERPKQGVCQINEQDKTLHIIFISLEYN